MGLSGGAASNGELRGGGSECSAMAGLRFESGNRGVSTGEGVGAHKDAVEKVNVLGEASEATD